MADVESSSNGASVGILPIVWKHFCEREQISERRLNCGSTCTRKRRVYVALTGIELDIIRVHGAVEGDRYHLRDHRRRQVTRNSRPVHGAPAIRQLAVLWVARQRAVGIVPSVCRFVGFFVHTKYWSGNIKSARAFLTAPAFVGSVGTVDAAVAKVCSWEASAIAASQILIIAVAVLEERPRWLRLCKALEKSRITIRCEWTRATGSRQSRGQRRCIRLPFGEIIDKIVYLRRRRSCPR